MSYSSKIKLFHVITCLKTEPPIVSMCSHYTWSDRCENYFCLCDITGMTTSSVYATCADSVATQIFTHDNKRTWSHRGTYLILRVTNNAHIGLSSLLSSRCWQCFRRQRIITVASIRLCDLDVKICPAARMMEGIVWRCGGILLRKRLAAQDNGNEAPPAWWHTAKVDHTHERDQLL